MGARLTAGGAWGNWISAVRVADVGTATVPSTVASHL
jgi:hypothetical protein